MKVPSRNVSSPWCLICPNCGRGRLRARTPSEAVCGLCDATVVDDVLTTLFQIATLPDAQGRHACECGHPEMRRLPDGVFHCPACGAEVSPSEPALLQDFLPEPHHTALLADVSRLRGRAARLSTPTG